MSTHAPSDTAADGAVAPLASMLRSRFGRPTVGAGAAARMVAEDAAALVRAEIDLAKTEFATAAKEKAAGAGLFAAAALFGFLALQALLIAVGFALAVVLPGWAAAGLVALGLLLLTGGLAAAGARRLSRPAGLRATKLSIAQDVRWAKERLGR